MPQDPNALYELLSAVNSEAGGRMTRDDLIIATEIYTDIETYFNEHLTDLLDEGQEENFVNNVFPKLFEEAAKRSMDRHPQADDSDDGLREFMGNRPMLGFMRMPNVKEDLFSFSRLYDIYNKMAERHCLNRLEKIRKGTFTDKNLKVKLLEEVRKSLEGYITPEDLSTAFDLMMRVIDADGDVKQKNLKNTVRKPFYELFCSLNPIKAEEKIEKIQLLATSFEPYLKQIHFLLREEEVPFDPEYKNAPTLRDAIYSLDLPQNAEECENEVESRISPFLATLVSSRNYQSHNSPELTEEEMQRKIRAIGTMFIYVTYVNAPYLEHVLDWYDTYGRDRDCF